jgi:hypothetical protein
VDIPICSREYLSQFLIEPNPHNGERYCKNSIYCIIRQLTTKHYGLVVPSEHLAPVTPRSSHVAVTKKSPIEDHDIPLDVPEYLRVFADPELYNTNNEQEYQKSHVAYGFIGREFLLPDQLEKSKSGELPEKVGLCLLCLRAQVSYAYHLSNKENYLPRTEDGRYYLPLNNHSVIVDKPGEYKSEICLGITNSNGSSGIIGFFPEFRESDYVFGNEGKIQFVEESGMDFHISSVM